MVSFKKFQKMPRSKNLEETLRKINERTKELEKAESRMAEVNEENLKKIEDLMKELEEVGLEMKQKQSKFEETNEATLKKIDGITEDNKHLTMEVEETTSTLKSEKSKISEIKCKEEITQVRNDVRNSELGICVNSLFNST